MYTEITSLIEDQLRDNWTDTLVDWDNVEFKPERGTAFIRLQTEITNANPISIGRRDRAAGYINVSIFVPANTGSVQVNILADKIGVIFNRWITTAIKFGIARTQRIGQQESWYRIDVIVPFTYDYCIVTTPSITCCGYGCCTYGN